MQYPENARENRQQFMLDFIMTGKIQVRSNAQLASLGHAPSDYSFFHACIANDIMVVQRSNATLTTSAEVNPKPGGGLQVFEAACGQQALHSRAATGLGGSCWRGCSHHS